ncbi:MAG: hypothetical protein JMDDDDMK_02514 [Acidobacteria bacterium]|nr:hypothetical protein [Acidobacteriota bacterium]
MRDVIHLAQAFTLKSGVAYGQHFVNQQDFGIEVRSDGEGQPQIHPAGVMLDRRVNELFDFGESDYLVELVFDLGAPHSQDCAVQVDVLASGQFRMKPGAYFEQRTDAPANVGVAFSRLGDAREDFQ